MSNLDLITIGRSSVDLYGAQITVVTSYLDNGVLEITPIRTSSSNKKGGDSSPPDDGKNSSWSEKFGERNLWLSFWAEVHYNSVYPKLEFRTPESGKKTKWSRLKMLFKRRSAASTVFNERTLWITGGCIDNQKIKTSEYVTLEGSKIGPSLPKVLGNHAMAKINGSYSIVVGGISDWNSDYGISKETYLVLSYEKISKLQKCVNPNASAIFHLCYD